MSSRAILALFGPLLAVAALPGPVSAHVRWFANAGKFANAEFLLDGLTLSLVAGALLYVAACVALERSRAFEDVSHRLASAAEKGRGIDWRLVAILTGIMLIGNALMGIYLAPNIELPNESLMLVGAVAQFVVGVLLLFQLSYVASGVAILFVAVLTLLLVPPTIMIDYVFEFVALAVALILVGPRYGRWDSRLFERLDLDPVRLERLAVPVIRVGVGLTLVTLALHNKLGNPGLTLAFLEEYHFNFMMLLGFESFTDLHFTFAAGVGELTLGILIALGIATRFVVATLTLFFLATLILLGPIELLGHAPLIAIAVMLILRGAGKKVGIETPAAVLRPA